jgi:hypothetical protein
MIVCVVSTHNYLFDRDANSQSCKADVTGLNLEAVSMLGFLRRHEQNKGLSGGQYYEYELDLDPEIVLETRMEIAEHTE